MIRHGALPDHAVTEACDLQATDGVFTNYPIWCLTHDAGVEEQ
jgi:hypothetical protein